MFAVTLVLTLLSAACVARSITAKTDGRGATIYTSPDFGGRAFAIPANDFCTNLNNIFGDFDAKTRSIMTEKGYRCEFYLDYGCLQTSPFLWIGSPSSSISLSSLRWDYDNQIHSAYCSPVSAAAAADIGRTGVQYMAPVASSKRSLSNADPGKTAAVLHTEIGQGGNALRIRANGQCYFMGNLQNGIPDLSVQVRSFSVNEGFVCHFFSQPDCYSESLPITGQTIDTLPKPFEGKIQSVNCLPVS